MMLKGYGKRTAASGATGWADCDGTGSAVGQAEAAVSQPDSGAGTGSCGVTPAGTAATAGAPVGSSFSAMVVC